jgi:hypothetical protein
MTKFMVCVLALMSLVFVGAVSTAVAQGPEFSLALTPANVALPQGSLTSFTLTIESSERPSFAVSLSGLPDGVQAQVPALRVGINNVILYASPTTPLGSYAVRVAASAGGNSQAQVLTLFVRPMPVIPQWEYTVMTADSYEEFLLNANNLGSQAWDLVSVTFKEKDFPHFIGFFKRLKR